MDYWRDTILDIEKDICNKCCMDCKVRHECEHHCCQRVNFDCHKCKYDDIV